LRNPGTSPNRRHRQNPCRSSTLATPGRRRWESNGSSCRKIQVTAMCAPCAISRTGPGSRPARRVDKFAAWNRAKITRCHRMSHFRRKCRRPSPGAPGSRPPQAAQAIKKTFSAGTIEVGFALWASIGSANAVTSAANRKNQIQVRQGGTIGTDLFHNESGGVSPPVAAAL
jgi:hypothetical protein